MKKRPVGNAKEEKRARRRMPKDDARLERSSAAVPAVSGIRVVVERIMLIEKSLAADATTPCTLQSAGPNTVGTVAYVPMPIPAAHAGTSCSHALVPGRSSSRLR